MTPRIASPKLSVALIVRNAAAELRQTLESINSVADEIVVLDTGSTDDTPAAAQEFAARMSRRPWDDDFAAARNACLANCSGDWILWLDAGEFLPEASLAALRRRLEQPLNCGRGYLLPVLLPATPGQIGGEQMLQLRLHPRLPGLKFAGRVRESLDQSLVAAGLQLESVEIPIHRPLRDHAPDVRTQRAKRNVCLADLEIAASGPSAALYNCLGEAWLALGDPLPAAQHHHLALHLAAAGSRDELEAYYGLLACLDVAGPDRPTQLAVAMKALGRFPLDAQLLVAVGGYLQGLGQHPLAIRSFDLAFRHGQIERRAWHLAEIREIAAVSAATAQQSCGDAAAACSLLEAAVCTFPNSARLSAALEEAAARAGRRIDLPRGLRPAQPIPQSTTAEKLPAGIDLIQRRN